MTNENSKIFTSKVEIGTSVPFCVLSQSDFDVQISKFE